MTDSGYLTIGKVVRRLQTTYPDLSVSKVRYLEDEGLLDPSRTSGGYRLYSPKDVSRLENILYLQKQRFLPLSVIKEELDAAESGRDSQVLPTVPSATPSRLDNEDDEMTSKMHPIEHMPDVADVSVSFTRQLAEAGLIQLHLSPHGRDLVDGHDLPVIRAASALRRYGIEPRNLRQYVSAANRESGMFEQALIPFSKRVSTEDADARKAEVSQAFDEVLSLTDFIRASLIRQTLKGTIKELSD